MLFAASARGQKLSSWGAYTKTAKTNKTVIGRTDRKCESLELQNSKRHTFTSRRKRNFCALIIMKRLIWCWKQGIRSEIDRIPVQTLVTNRIRFRSPNFSFNQIRIPSFEWPTKANSWEDGGWGGVVVVGRIYIDNNSTTFLGSGGWNRIWIQRNFTTGSRSLSTRTTQ